MNNGTKALWRVGIACLALTALAPGRVRAEIIGGVDFPQGKVSFADAVVSFNPKINASNQPNPEFRDPLEALGPPDFAAAVAAGKPSHGHATLGAGGSITLRFLDNALTGSGNANLDLWIFEVGPDVEDTEVEISKDGITWLKLDNVGGATAGLDIDKKGVGPGDLYFFVRLTDVASEGQTTGPSHGADIDAVGAITTIPLQVGILEPSALLLLGGGLLDCAGLARRRRAGKAGVPRDS